MSLKHLADNIAAHGRQGDDMLVHVNKKELMALQALANKHGKSLTTNPHTGMPEAFGLRQILPMAAGFALAGPAGMTAVEAGLAVGAASTLASGNLKQGMMDGLGAWGGAGLAGAAPAAAAPTTAATAGTGAGTAAQTAIPEVATTAGYTPQIASGTPLSEVNSLNAANTISTTGTAGSQIPGGTLAENYTWDPLTRSNVPIPETTVNTGSVTGSAMDAATGGPYGGPAAQEATRGILPGMKEGFSNIAANAAAHPSYLAAGLAPAIADELAPKPYAPPTTKGGDADMGQRLRFKQGNVEGPNGQYAAPEYVPISNAEAKKLYGYAEGGDVQYPYSEPVVRMYDGGDTSAQLQPGLEALVPEHAKSALRGSVLKAQGPQEERTYAAGGGLSSLGGYSDGGRLLKGPGDGMSDNIPAQIGQKQPARLADGEFVVPADVVSHLGNGSTDAGAKQLYKMMDKIRSARTGRKSQGKQINPNKFMPS